MTWVQSIAGFSATATGTQTITVAGPNSTLVISMNDGSGGGTTLTVTDTTDARAFLHPGGNVSDGAGNTIGLFYLQNVTPGVKIISFATTGSGSLGIFWTVSEYSNVAISGGADATRVSFDTVAPGTAVGALKSGTYSAPTAGDTVVGICMLFSGPSTNSLVGATGTQRAAGVMNSAVKYCIEDQIANGTVQSTFTDAVDGAGANYDYFCIALKPFVAAGGPTWVQTITGNVSSGGTATITVAAGSVILVCVEDLTAIGRTITASDAQGTYALVSPPGQLNSTGAQTLALRYLANANAGAHVITLAATGGDSLYYAITEYSGVSTTAPVFASAGQSQNNPVTPSSGTYNSGSGNRTVGLCWCSNNVDATLVAASGTSRFNAAVSSILQHVIEDQASTGAGDASVFTSVQNQQFATFSVALTPPAAGGNTGGFFSILRRWS